MFKFDVRATEKNGKKILNLSYGEPTKANGYELHPNISVAVIEAV